jgi:hypothetical protein
VKSNGSPLAPTKIEKSWKISSNSAVTSEELQKPSWSNANLSELLSPDAFTANEPDLVEAKSTEQASSSEDPNAGLRIPTNLGEGLPIEQVFIYLRNPTGDVEQDEAFQQQIADTFRIRAGGSFSTLFADQGLNEVQQLPFVKSAEYRLYESNRPGTVIIALLVTLQPKPSEEPPAGQQPSGMVISGSFRDFPILYQSDRALVKFVLNGGIGIFSDSNPWFYNMEDFFGYG